VKFIRLTSIFILSSCSILLAQIGGDNSFEFLNLVHSARIASLGGGQIAHRDADLNLAFQNPGSINSEMNNQLVLNFVNYFSDIHYGIVGYGKSLKKGTLTAGMQYINYGTFTAAQENGLTTGEFKAGEYALNIGYGRMLDSNFTLGVQLKPIYSSFEQYNAFGAAADVGISYYLAKARFGAGIVVKNLGMQFKGYVKGNNEPLPFEIQAGVTHKLKHAPFRFILSLDHLEKWDLRYPDSLTVKKDFEKRKINLKGPFIDNLAKHVNVATEIVLTKNLNLRIGYNFRRRRELQTEERKSITGLSFGAGIKISKFQISYALASYHLAAKSHHISLGMRLSDFYSKK